MKTLMKVIFFTLIFFLPSYSQVAPNFTLKDRNNHTVKLKNFKNYKVVVLAFLNTKDKISIIRLKELKKNFDNNSVKFIVITIDKNLSPIDFNNFVGKNNFSKLGIAVVKGDSWVLKAYSINKNQPSFFILRKYKNDFLILKKFNGQISLDDIKVSIEKALNR